jgi:phage terminase small subunit
VGNADTKLKDKQRLFCIEYLVDLNATQAAIRAGYSKRTSYSIGNENLKKPEIQEEISKQIEALLERAKIPLEKKLFDFWMKRAFYDVTEIIDLDGKVKLTEAELRDKGLHVCIDSINKKVNAQGVTIVTYEFADKDKAAETLQRYIQMIKDGQPPGVKVDSQLVNINILLQQQVRNNPKEGERIIGQLGKLTGYTE